MTVQLDENKIQKLIEEQEKILNDNTQKSKQMFESADHLSNGVASAYQARDPWPIYIDRGSGAKIWDVDGNEYYDFHNG